MARPIRPGWRESYLLALAETGNATLAATRVAVARSTVTRARAADDGFDQAVRRALAAARDRLLAADGIAPPPGWATDGGRPLLIRRGARRPQIARARADDWTPDQEAELLRLLADGWLVGEALAAVGRSYGGGFSHNLLWPAFHDRAIAAFALGAERNRLRPIADGPARFAEFGLPPTPAVLAAARDAAEALARLDADAAARGFAPPGHGADEIRCGDGTDRTR